MAEESSEEAPPAPPRSDEIETFLALDTDSAPPPSPEQTLQIAALVLTARGIPFRIVSDPRPGTIEVPAAHLISAKRELTLFRQENRNWPPVAVSLPPPADNTYTTLAVLALLAVFHNLVHGGLAVLGLSGQDWMALGRADAGAILSGEWWRAVTALTLHADTLHLAANLLLGGPLAIRLCRALGSGLGWSLILATGVLGNLTNALVQDSQHLSIGSSTALFGTLGLLAGMALVKGQQAGLKRWALPLAAALALLALLGTGTDNIDVEAHLFGFSWGVVLGVPVGWQQEHRGPAGKGVDWLWGAGSLMLVIGCWWTALNAV